MRARLAQAQHGRRGVARRWGREAGPVLWREPLAAITRLSRVGMQRFGGGRGEETPALDSSLGQSRGRGAATRVFSRGRCSWRWAGVG